MNLRRGIIASSLIGGDGVLAPRSYYKFNNDVTDEYDLFNGSLTGSLTYGVVSGKQSAYFGGASRVDIGNALYSTTSFSVSLWWNTNTASGHPLVVSRPTDNDRNHININASAFCQVQVKDGTTVKAITDTVALDDGNWHHLVYVVDRENDLLYMYVDNGLVSSVDMSSVGAIPIDTFIGYYEFSTTYATGYFAYIRIYDLAITGETVTDIYNLGK